MATNPMQRKARMYALLGSLVTLIITGMIIVFLVMQLMNMKKEQATYRTVFVLKEDVKSGQSVADKVEVQRVPLAAYPENAFHNEEEDKQIAANPISSTAIAKVNLAKGTVITETMVTEPDETETKDMRKVEYNMIVLPSQLEVDDYIDVRLQLPNGQNYIVVSKKRVLDADATTVWLNLSEYEILMMSSATVEAYMMTGSKLYAVTYTEAGNQEQATGTYYPKSEVAALMDRNPNIAEQAKNWLNTNLRANSYQATVELYQEKGLENIESGISEEVTKSVEARQKYVDGL